MLEAVDF